jgi:C4-dicarboxylate-specific signal transduction histidine kinase
MMRSGPVGITAIAKGYGIALFITALALATSLLLRPFFPHPFLLALFAAVMAAAWFGGTGPGFFSVFLSTAAVDYFFVQPLHSWAINATDMAYFASFVVCALAASEVSSVAKRHEEDLRQARDQMEERVAQRTEELEKANAELKASIDQHEEAQQALMNAQAELAHLSRYVTMGELTASIAHEVNQPLTAVLTYANACLEWLSADPPVIDEARLAAETIVKDGARAAAVLGRIRALFQNRPTAKDWIDMNEAIHELLSLLRREAARHGIYPQTELAPDLPKVKGDRVRLQQVILNLMMNAIDAVRETAGRSKQIRIRSQKEGPAAIRISVEDNGCGFASGAAEKMFQPFFTTKPQGIGMGLSISRSIVESHGGRLWAEAKQSGGSVFHMRIPIEA